MKAIINAKLCFPEEIREGSLLMEGKTILAAGDVKIPEGAEIIDARGLYAGPGLVDEHCHGYQQCGEFANIVDDPLAVAANHLLHGTTSITPSAGYTNSLESYLFMIGECQKGAADENSSIVGMHFEGPFVSSRFGAHSELANPYSREFCDKIFAAAKGMTVHSTYAPEIPAAPEYERLLTENGIIHDIGHTGAGPADIERAVANGARIVTHLYDAMGNYRGVEEASFVTGDPQDCVSDIVLGTPGLYYELICDSIGAHVTKYSIRKAYRAAGEDFIILITDSTAHKDIPVTEEARAKVFDHFGVYEVDDLNFNDLGELSGSRLTLDKGCHNFMKATGCDVRVAFKCASTNPARALGLSAKIGSIEAGHDADILLVDDDFYVHKLFFKGKEIENIRH